MKKTIQSCTFLLLITAVSLFSISCKKNADAPVVPATSQWTFNNITYKPSTVINTLGGMFSIDGTGAGQDAIYLGFGTSSPANGTYTVVDVTGPGPKMSANQCSIIVETKGNTRFSSVGVADNTVTVNVSANKITASFNNVTLVSIANNQVTSTQNVSGTLVSVMQ